MVVIFYGFFSNLLNPFLSNLNQVFFIVLFDEPRKAPTRWTNSKVVVYTLIAATLF